MAPSRSIRLGGPLPPCAPPPLPALLLEALEHDRLMGAVEVARALSVSRRYVYDLEHSGRLPALRVGRHLRFHPRTVAAFIGAAVPVSETMAGDDGGR
jgi:excisionase family DNA binding protein